MMKRSFVALATAGAICVGAGNAQAQVYDLTLCGASPGGLWTLLGAGLDAAVKQAYPGSTVTYQTSGGGLANVALLDQGRCDLAIIHDAEALVGLQGMEPFNAPIESMATIATLYTWAPMQVIAHKSYVEQHGLTSLEDIAEKELPVRIVLNRRGNIVSSVGESMLNAAGASVENIQSWGGDVQFSASSEQADQMRDRRADLLINSLFVNHSSIRELASAIDLALLPIREETARAVMEEWQIDDFTISAEDYDWVDNDTLTVTVAAQLFVRADADEEMVTNLTQAMVDNVGELQGVHGAMAPLDVELMASARTVDYHPAARAVYEAAGY